MEHTIGTRLRHAREERGLEIAQVAEAVRLRPGVVQWLEADDFTPCGPAAYVRGYLRSLASYLELPADELVADYTRTYQPAAPSAVPRVARAPRRTQREAAADGDGRGSGDHEPPGRPSTRSRKWLPMMWFIAILVIVAALGYSLVTADAHRRSTVRSTSGAHSQTFSPSPAPFSVDRIEPARMPVRVRA